MRNAAESAGAAGPFRDHGSDRAADAAADFAGAAVPSRDRGTGRPDGAADGPSQSTPQQADDTTERPFGERADASVRCTGLGVSTASDEAWAGYLLLLYAKIIFR